MYDWYDDIIFYVRRHNYDRYMMMIELIAHIAHIIYHSLSVRMIVYAVH